MKASNEVLGAAMAGAAGVIWGLLGLVTRNLSNMGFTCIQMTFMRYLFTFIALGALIFFTDRNGFKVDLKLIPVFAAVGILGSAMNSTTYFMSMQRITIALATIVQYIAPFIVVLLSVPIFGEKLTKVKLASVVVAFIGCIFCTGILTSAVSLDILGIALAFVSAICFASYTLGSKAAERRGGKPAVTLFYASLFCWVFCLPFCDAPQAFSTLFESADHLLLMLLLGLGVTLVPFGIYNIALTKIEAGKASVISYVEPLTSTVVGLVCYGESITIGLVIGIALIFTSVVTISGFRLKEHPEPGPE